MPLLLRIKKAYIWQIWALNNDLFISFVKEPKRITMFTFEIHGGSGEFYSYSTKDLFFMCVCLCAYICTCVRVPMEAWRGFWVPEAGIIGGCELLMVLGSELRVSARAVHTLKHWAIPVALRSHSLPEIRKWNSWACLLIADHIHYVLLSFWNSASAQWAPDPLFCSSVHWIYSRVTFIAGYCCLPSKNMNRSQWTHLGKKSY